MIYIYLAIIALAIWGLQITAKIYREKRKGGPMICPLGANCKDVVNSEFSSFFGIGLEIFGILYYLMIIASYLTLMIFPQLFSDLMMFLLTGFTIGAFFFSIYLTLVQAFYLKSWCTWCLCSAGASTTIFILSTVGLFVRDISFIPIFEYFHQPILILHLLGFAIGVGGATFTDILFFKFLKDFKISPAEDKILKVMSQVIWVGLLFLIISGIGLYIPNMEALNHSSKFLVKVVVVGIIVLNGVLLNLVVSPKLIKISFKGTGLVNSLQRTRKIAFASGAISFVSWYSAFILGSLKSIPLTFIQLLSIYLAIVFIAVVFSQITEKVLGSKKK
ncbi:MAG: putative membrane protein [Candidatus Paceibacteria bacterium]|jgi:uncharacterized membrane protein